MNVIVLLSGAATLYILGVLKHNESMVSMGLGLMWVGMATLL